MVPDHAPAGVGSDSAREPLILVTPGDPDGVGPEVTVRAWAEGARAMRVVGDAAALVRAGAPVWSIASLADPVPSGRLGVFDPGDTPASPVELAAIRWATQACLAGRADALVTGPIHKAKLARRGMAHPGHTELLGALCGVERPVMAFVGGALQVALVTVHLPLRRVPDALTEAGVLHTLRAVHAAPAPRRGRIAVCGLNPHAGDEGLLGDEEARVIGPAVAAAQREGVDAIGPISAEAAFRAAVAGEVAWVVAMYHDQGLAPLKAVDFGRSVNWTLGLPILRTSVDHGTAYDRVGTGQADPGSMIAAWTLARDLCASRRLG